jgi:hypothetical protein
VDVGEPEDADRRRTVVTAAPPLQQGMLEQYQLAVEMADRVSARRATANGFFLTVQTTLIALLAVDDLDRAWVSAAGLVFAAAWWLLLRSYRDLSGAKWKVIQDIESRLPLQPFSDEWASLKQDPVKWWRPRYAELGFVERLVPLVFGVICLITLLSV